MMSRWLWLLSKLSARLWLRASLYGVFAVATALFSIYGGHYIPESIPSRIGADAAGSILKILASSMLAVAIFSLSTMVSAFSMSGPRASTLLIEDTSSHKALSTFIGTFIFSIVGLIALQAGVYGQSGRLILFLVTIVVVMIVVITFLHWIEYLSKLGRVGQVIEQVEVAATDALRERLRWPYLGGMPLMAGDEIPESAVSITPEKTGYIEFIDMAALQHAAEQYDSDIYVTVLPGKFVAPSVPLAWIRGTGDEEAVKAVRNAFVIGHERSYRQDPRYGATVLSEIASRALSPAVNDPGTAIQVADVGVRVLSQWSEWPLRGRDDHEIRFKNVYVSDMQIGELVNDLYAPIARDGAGIIELGLKLQHALKLLADAGNDELASAARQMALICRQRNLDAFTLSADQECLEQAAAWIVRADRL